jgi:hypothetical protein
VIKKVLVVVIGFGMITGGIAGIITSLVDQENQATLKHLEKIQDEAKTAAAEEQRKLEEKQQEIDRLAMRIEAERSRLQEDRRRLEQRKRSKMAATEKQKRKATEPKTATRKDYVKGKAGETGRKGVLSSRPSPTTEASRLTVHEEDVRRISQKAGLEAARSFAPVKYYNRNTRELVLAEPFNNGPGSVLVRIRVWKGERLAQDTLINFSKASLGGLRRWRPYL